MNSKTVRPLLSTPPAPQRWATAASWTAFLSALPSAAWRMAMLTGVETGFAEADLFRHSTAGTAYVLGLETIQVGGAVLCLGLCRPWGEQVPQWVPRLGGRVLPRALPTVVGGTGNALLYLLIGGTAGVLGTRWLGLAPGWTPTDGMNAHEAAVLAIAYAPMLLWPPALTVALVGYWRRRA